MTLHDTMPVGTKVRILKGRYAGFLSEILNPDDVRIDAGILKQVGMIVGSTPTGRAFFANEDVCLESAWIEFQEMRQEALRKMIEAVEFYRKNIANPATVDHFAQFRFPETSQLIDADDWVKSVEEVLK